MKSNRASALTRAIMGAFLIVLYIWLLIIAVVPDGAAQEQPASQVEVVQGPGSLIYWINRSDARQAEIAAAVYQMKVQNDNMTSRLPADLMAQVREEEKTNRKEFTFMVLTCMGAAIILSWLFLWWAGKRRQRQIDALLGGIRITISELHEVRSTEKERDESLRRLAKTLTMLSGAWQKRLPKDRPGFWSRLLGRKKPAEATA